MVSIQDSHSKQPNNLNQSRSHYYYTPPPLSAITNRSNARSMRTIRSKFFQNELTDSLIDFQLNELTKIQDNSPSHNFNDILESSHSFSSFSSDISEELNLLASLTSPNNVSFPEPELSSETMDNISPQDLHPTVNSCIDGLRSPSIEIKRSSAAKLRLLAKNRSENRAMIGACGAVPVLVQHLCCSDSFIQEHAVTALLNLSLYERNKGLMVEAGAIKLLVYVLKTGTEVSKQNAACALLSLALVEENKLSIGACGAISPLVGLLVNGNERGKKDALTTLYKLCSVKLNKERAVNAGAIRVLVGLVGMGLGIGEKAMVVMSSLGGIEMGRDAIVEEGGIEALVEVIESETVSEKGKEFAVLTLMVLCGESVRNRGLLVSEGGIPPLVALSQNGTVKAKHKAETLLGYLRESREEAYSSIS